MSYSVYTPPDWQPNESLPLMLLLHGAADNHESFDRWFVGNELDLEINSGKLPRVIIVSPDGEFGFWENWHDGSRLYRDWVVKDLMPHIRKQYNTLPCPNYCYISGISMGGHGALRFAYYEPNTFNSAAILSAPIMSKLYPGKNSIGAFIMKLFIPFERIWGDMDGDTSHTPKDLDPYISWHTRPHLKELPLLLVWGNEDSESIIKANQQFQKHLSAQGKHHSWYIYEGGHKWVFWREIMADVIRFHVNASVSGSHSPILHSIPKPPQDTHTQN